MFSVSYSQGDVCRGLTPSRSDEHSRWETGASTSGSGPCTCSENGSSIQDGIGEWLLESRWSWHPHAQQTPHHVQRCCASHCNLEHKKCNCCGGGRVGGTPAPHPSSRLTADNWIRNSPVHVCSRAGAPNLWIQVKTSCQMNSSIGLEATCAINVMRLNHPQTILPTPGSWKNGLP